MLLVSLLHLYILRVRSSLWGIHFKKKYPTHMSWCLYRWKFPSVLFHIHFSTVMLVYEYVYMRNINFYLISKEKWKKFTPWRARGVGKYLTRNFVLLFFCLLLLRPLLQLYCYYNSSHSDNGGKNHPFSTNIYKVRFFSFMGLGWYTVREEMDVRVDRVVDCRGEAYRLFPRIILR